MRTTLKQKGSSTRRNYPNRGHNPSLKVNKALSINMTSILDSNCNLLNYLIVEYIQQRKFKISISLNRSILTLEVEGLEENLPTNMNRLLQKGTQSDIKNSQDHLAINLVEEHENMRQKCKMGKNWQKVKNIVKKLKNNALMASSKDSHSCIGLLSKEQRMQSFNERQQTIERAKLSKHDCKLAINSEIVETRISVDTGIEFKTYRPVPKIQYLVDQPIGKGEVDTTGAWAWEAEETLAYFLTKMYNKYQNSNEVDTKVLQIGAGCSGLAALTYAKLWQSNINQARLHIVVTDGRPDNIFFIDQNIRLNFPSKCQKMAIEAQQYLWGCQLSNHQNFDLILAADCLFFEQFHEQLIKSLSIMLRDGSGVCLFVNPKRGYSVANFLKRLDAWSSKSDKYSFSAILIEFNDQKYQKSLQKMQSSPNYNADVNEFMFLQVRKVPKMESSVNNSQQ